MEDISNRPFALSSLSVGISGVHILKDGVPFEPADDFFSYMRANTYSEATILAYARALVRLFNFLDSKNKDWLGIKTTDMTRFVEEYDKTKNPQRKNNDQSPASTVINPITRKANPSPGYAASTINLATSAIAMFYDFHCEANTGPSKHPFPDRTERRARKGGRRLGSFRKRGPKRQGRALNEEQWKAFFDCLTHDRDRALFSLAHSAAVRADELLKMTLDDVDWSTSCIRVITKGSQSLDWVAASPNALNWLTVYLKERRHMDPLDPLWTTLDQKKDPFLIYIFFS